MLFELFPILSWLAMFVAFLWAARSPRQVVAMRRSFLLEDAPMSNQDIWILRGLSVLGVACATYAGLATGHPALVLALVPIALLLHFLIEAMRRGLLASLAGRHWHVRLVAIGAWSIAALAWRDGAHALAVLLLCAGVAMAAWPGSVARFLANYATEEKQVKWTRVTGIAGCVMSIVVLVTLVWLAARRLVPFDMSR